LFGVWVVGGEKNGDRQKNADHAEIVEHDADVFAGCHFGCHPGGPCASIDAGTAL